MSLEFLTTKSPFTQRCYYCMVTECRKDCRQCEHNEKCQKMEFMFPKFEKRKNINNYIYVYLP